MENAAQACPDRTRAIPYTVRAVTGQFPGEETAIVQGRLTATVTATAAANG
jgi:hypothetical protein